MVRKRVPMEIREIEGTARASTRKRAAGSPEIAVKTVLNVPGLSTEGKKHWPLFREMFKNWPVVAETDIVALQRMVECYAEVRIHMRTLEKEGWTLISSTRHGDNERAHPASGMLADADRRFRAYITDFGLTPTSRSRAKGDGNGNKTKDPLDDFLP